MNERRLLETLSGIKFERVLSRSDAILRPTRESRYATVKPLAKVGFNKLSRVLLIDDTLDKAMNGEEKNLVSG